MSDIRPVAGTIRASLHSPDLTIDDKLRRAAEAYANACQQANERLSRCADLLSHGMRSEALRLAELTPDLLELVTELDFPERQDWDDRVLMNDLPLPAPLNR